MTDCRRGGTIAATSAYRCPSGCDLRGETLPAEQTVRRRGRTHTSRRVGLWDVTEGLVRGWWCPDCGAVWAR